MSLSLPARFWSSVLRRAYQDRRLSIDAERRREQRAARLMTRLPVGADLDRSEIAGVRAIWLRPRGAPRDSLVLHFHGGGYVLGSPDSHVWMCGPMARALGMELVLPYYRLAPEHPFPASLEDALAVYRGLVAQGYAASRILVSGDSAGGGLGLALVLALKEAGEALPGGVLCLSPWTDLTHSGGSHVSLAGKDALLRTETLREWAALYAGAERLDHPLVSPIYGDLRGFPPLLIQVGSEEILLDDSVAFAEKARAAGVAVSLKVWKGLWHVWPAFRELIPESRLAFEEMGRFARARGLR
jgi:acetyl esterase/lipase